MSGVNLDSLRITNRDLDELTGLDISDLSMGRGTRLAVFQRPRLRWTWLLNQSLVQAVALVLWLPVCLVVGRNLSEQALGLSLGVGVGGAIATTAAYGLYGVHQGRQLKVLSHLLDEVDRFNEMIKAVEILEELRQVDGTSKRLSLDDPEAVKEALHLTRESLVCGLMSDRIMRKHQRFIARRHELFTSIETNLSSLQALRAADMAGDYGQLLNEALQVGTAVHQELRKIDPQTHDQTP